MNVDLLGELLGLLKTLNETIGVPGESLEDKNILQGNNPSDPNKRISPTLNSNERKRTTEIASLFAKTFFEYQKKKTPDKAIKTSVQKITRQSSKPIPAPPSNKPGSMLAGILALLGGAGALLLGLLTDGPFKGALKILSKLGIQGGIKILVNGAKAFIGTLSKFITAPFKMVGKLFGKGVFKNMLSALKPFSRILKRIPLIGTIISIGFAISRFNKGQNVRGVIDVLSGLVGLLDIVAPGVGFTLSLGLDMLNAWMDVKMADPKNKGKSEMDVLGEIGNTIGSWIWKNALWIPVVGGFKRMHMSYEAFKGGNIKDGLYQFGMGLLSFGGLSPIVTGIEMLMGFGDKKENDKSLSPKSGWFQGLKEWIKKKLKDLPYALRKPLEWFGILDDSGSGEIDAGFSKNVSDKFNNLKEYAGKAWQSASEGFSKGFNWFKEKSSSLWNAMSKGFSKGFDSIKKNFPKMVDSFGKFFTSLTNIFKPAIDKISNFMTDFVGKVVNWIKNIWSPDEEPEVKKAEKSRELTDQEKLAKANKMGHKDYKSYEKSGWKQGDYVSPEELERRAKKYGWNSVEEYKKSNWGQNQKGMVANAAKIANQPKVEVATENKLPLVQSGNPLSLKKLEDIGLAQLKTMGDIRNSVINILKKMDGIGGGGSNTNISVSPQQSSSKSSPIPMNTNRGEYGSSPYALA